MSNLHQKIPENWLLLPNWVYYLILIVSIFLIAGCILSIFFWELPEKWSKIFRITSKIGLGLLTLIFLVVFLGETYVQSYSDNLLKQKRLSEITQKYNVTIQDFGNISSANIDNEFDHPSYMTSIWTVNHKRVQCTADVSNWDNPIVVCAGSELPIRSENK